MMKVGFTGSRLGMSIGQFDTFTSVIGELLEPITVFRFGCCRGADVQAARLIATLVPKPMIFGHLSTLDDCEEAIKLCEDTCQPEPPLLRNIDIVKGCDILIACPKGPEEQRSGTWSTVRYARKVKRHIVVIWPDGKVTEENKP